MKTPTAEEVATIKASALKRFGSDRAQLVTIADPVDAAIVVAPFDLAGWARYIDALSRDQDTAYSQTYIDRLLWPSLEEAIAIRTKYSAVAQKVVIELMNAAGSVAGQPKIESAFELPEGIGDAALAEQIKAGGAYWIATLPSGHRAILKAPQAETYLAARAAVQAARAKHEGIIAAQVSFWKECVVCCSKPVDALIERSPALTLDFWAAYQLMAGEGAAVISKSL